MTWEVRQGDARQLARAFQPSAPTVVITDPVWPNRGPTLFPGIDEFTLLRDTLLALVGKVSHVVVHVGVRTDPRFLLAVPGAWTFWRTCWLRYHVPSYQGCALIGSECAYVFGPERHPTRARVAPGECTAAGRLGKGPTKHPCPRSVEHLRWLVRWFTQPGETVLDPFCGSGTTLVAAHEHGRSAVGWDIDAEYCALAEGRLAQQQLPLGRVRPKEAESP